jgi:hypothetical protein
MKFKKPPTKISVSALSAAVTLFLCELAARLVFDAADFVSVEMDAL